MENTVRAITPTGEPLFLNYIHSMANRNGFPASATFEITSRCNFNCKMCYIHSADCSGNADEELTAEQWIDIARQARDAGVVAVLITGGEPLVRNDFPLIYSSIKKLGLLVSVNTNGSLITDETAKLFMNDPPARLNISLYGASEKTYRELCGNESFGKVYGNIKRLAQAGIQIKLNMSITPLNCTELEKMLGIAKELGVHSKATTYMYPTVRRPGGTFGENPARFTADEAGFYRAKYDLLRFGKEEFLRRAEKLAEGFAEREECYDPAQEGEAMRCRAGTSSCWINYKGEMNACGIFSNGNFNVLKNGFQSSWQAVRESAKKIKTPAQCVDCRVRNLCPVCAAVCKSETGSTEKAADYVCEFSRACEKYISALAERIKDEDQERTVFKEDRG